MPLAFSNCSPSSLRIAMTLREVDLVERGQHRDRVLRLHQALGDALADARHRHALFRARAAGHAGGLAAGVVDDVFLGHAAAAAGAGDLRRVDAFLATRRSARRAAVRRWRPAPAWCCRRRRLRPRRPAALGWTSAARAAGGGFRRLGGFGAAAAAPSSMTAMHLLAGDGGAFLNLSSLSTPSTGEGTSSTTLSVSRSTQVLVALDRIAGLLVPGGDGGVGDGFREDRDFDFDGSWAASCGNVEIGGYVALFGGVAAVERG